MIMTPRSRLWTASGPAIALVLFAFQRPAGAEPAPPARTPTKSVAADDDDAEAEAKEHFKSGNDHFDKQEWPEALDEFRRALALKKTRATMVNEASCLKQLGRYDEGLDHFEALRAELPDLPRRWRPR